MKAVLRLMVRDIKQLYGGTAVKKKLLALALVLVFFISAGNTSAFAYAFPGTSASKRDDVRYFDMTAAEYIDRFNAKYGSMGLTLLADPSHDNCWLAVNGDRTDIRIQFSDKINGPVTTGSGLDMQEWNWLYAYITTSDYSVDTQFFASLPMLCSQLASVLGCDFTQEEFIDHCTTYGSDYPRMQYTKGGVENEIRFRDSSFMDYHQTVYSVSILLLQNDSNNSQEVAVDLETVPVQADSSEYLRIVDVSYNNSTLIALYSDGTVVTAGSNSWGQCNVSDWRDIAAVAAGQSHTVGLRTNGTVVAVGGNFYGECDVSNWDDITAIAAGLHTVGLKKDGTVIAAGWNDYGQCNVTDWTDIVYIAASDEHTVGVKKDGTVIAVGSNGSGKCDVSRWTGITAVSASNHTVGLKADGSVVATGWNSNRQCDVSGWSDIVAVAAGWAHTVGLKKDGTVVAVGWNGSGECDVSGWTDIVAIAAGHDETFGLKKDGTILCTRIMSIMDELNAPVLAAKENSHKDSTGSNTTQSPASNGPAAPSTDFNYNILQNEPGYIYDKFDDYWTWYAAYDEAYTDANLLIGIQLEGEVGGSDLAGATLYTKIRNKDNRVIDGVQSMIFLVDGVKYSFPEMPGEDGAMAGSVVLYKNGYELIKAFANAKEVSVKLKLFSGGTVLLDLDSAQFDRTLGNMCRKIIQYKVWDYYIENPGVEMLEMMFPMEITKK
jgi:alpha-tubulin suppressor-like RCC1 family protein